MIHGKFMSYTIFDQLLEFLFGFMEIRKSQLFTYPVNVSLHFMRVNRKITMMLEVGKAELETGFVVIIAGLFKRSEIEELSEKIEVNLTYIESC